MGEAYHDHNRQLAQKSGQVRRAHIGDVELQEKVSRRARPADHKPTPATTVTTQHKGEENTLLGLVPGRRIIE